MRIPKNQGADKSYEGTIMDSERPRVMPPRTPLDYSLETAALLLLVGLTAFACASYFSLPERIPTHFDLTGKPDAWGPRSSVFLLVGVSAFLYAVLTIVGFIKPWYWNIPAKVTQENALRVYSSTMRLLRIMKIEAMGLMFLVLWLVVASARAGSVLWGWLPLAAVGVIVATVIAGLITVRLRARHKEPPALRQDGAASAPSS